MNKKVLVVGLDGATWELMDPWFQQGLLPNLARIAEGGVRGDLTSTVPPLSAPAWASFLSGKQPNNHGIYAFSTRIKGDYTSVPVNGSHLRAETLAETVSRHSRRAVQINVPITYPPRRVQGVWVSGLDTPSVDVPFAFPDRVKAELVQRYSYEIEADASYRPGDEACLVRGVEAVERKRADATLCLLRSEPWDLFMVVFRGIDILSHLFWRFQDPDHPRHDPHLASKYGSTILDHYRFMDEVVGELLAEIPDDVTTMVVSDHGFGPHLRWINLNDLFIRIGLLQSRQQAARKALRSVQRSSTANLLRTLLPLRFRLSAGRAVRLSKNIDWTRSAVYPVEGQGLLRLNVRGRDPQGCIQPGPEVERTIEFIIDELGRLRDPVSQEKVLKRVWRWKDVYGSVADDSPDLWIEWQDGYMAKKAEFLFPEGVFSDYVSHCSGNHRVKGVFMVSGPGTRQGRTVHNANIIDVAPTILHLLGLPVPDDMDGKVLSSILREGQSPVEYEKAAAPRQQGAGYIFSAEEQELVENRLKGLGYL